MSYGIHEDDKRTYRLADKIIVINEKAHNERTHVIMFKDTKYADDYFVNKIKGNIAKIVKSWSYYIWYYKVQFGDEFKFYCVHQNDEYKDCVYETKLIGNRWIDVCQIEENSPIYDLIMCDFNKKENKRKENVYAEQISSFRTYNMEHQEYEEDEKDYYDLFGQDEEEEPWSPGPFGDSNLRRY